MQLTYKYKLKPTKEQEKIIASQLEMARRQYNYRLGERLKWFEATRTRVDACPLNTAIVSVDRIYENIPEYRIQTRDGRKKDENGNPITKKGDKHPNIVNGYVEWEVVQLADLKNTKKLFPEYKAMHSQVLQDVVQRVQTTMDNYTVPDKNGKTSGKPKFKGYHYYNSFTYPQLKDSKKSTVITNNHNGRFCVNLSKIGLVPFVYNRAIPKGFDVKTGTIVREADGWYICLTIEDKSVPVQEVETLPTEENSKGIDLGLIYYAVTSNGEFVDAPKFFRKTEARLARLQRRLSNYKNRKNSKPWRILKKKIAKVHQLIARQRADWQFKLAYRLFADCEVIFIEDLSVANLIRRCQAKLGDDGKYLPNGQAAKSGQNKSLVDAAFGQFREILSYVAWKLGKRVIAVNPRGTSQHCWNCFNRVFKELSDRWHSCSECGQELDRDYNSAKLIKNIGLLSTQGEGITSVKTAVRLLRTEESRVVA